MLFKNEQEVSPENVQVGMLVHDGEHEGVIQECDDHHNVLVNYKNKGVGLFCIVPDCPDGKDNLYQRVTPQPNE
jgi:hypothetical protein